MPNQPRAKRASDGTCERCGQQHPKCAGHSKRTGKPCGKSPIIGGTVCATHGGSAPQVRAAATRRLAAAKLEREAAATLDLVEIQEITDPLGLLLEVLAEIRAFQLFLANRVAELG